MTDEQLWKQFTLVTLKVGSTMVGLEKALGSVSLLRNFFQAKSLMRFQDSLLYLQYKMLSGGYGKCSVGR